MKEIENKLKKYVEELADYADKNGRTGFSTCSASYYGWDRDIWAHRHSIIEALRKRGFQVSSSVNHGVTDVEIVKPLNL